MESARERANASVVVIGGGPAGLAAAAALRARGIDAIVLESADDIGASWKAHYDRLHLHTVRRLSGLPGLPIPRREGRWVSRDGVVRYLENYARHHRLDVRLGTSATSLERRGSSWRVDTDRGPIAAGAVVVATGYNRRPVMPEWPGAESFDGELLHSSAYRSGSAYRGKDAMVVGAGNSGAEITVDLIESGARRVWLSVRTPPNILRRQLAGVPTQAIGIALRRLPPPVVDKIAAVTQRVTVGDLSKYGMPPPERGVYTRVLSDERIPILDVGLVAALRKRAVTVVPALERFDRPDAVLAGGRRIAPDVVIAATGFRRGLHELVGHLAVLDDKGNPRVHGPTTAPQAPQLYFIGYSNPLSGNLRELGIDARRIAKAIAASPIAADASRAAPKVEA